MFSMRMGMGLGAGTSAVVSGEPVYSDEYTAYASRVATGGGAVVDADRAAAKIDWLVDSSLYSNLVSGHLSYGGLIKDGSDNIGTVFDIAASNPIDLTQSTPENKPTFTEDGIQFTNDWLVSSLGAYTAKFQGKAAITISMWLNPTTIGTIGRSVFRAWIGDTVVGIGVNIGADGKVTLYTRSNTEPVISIVSAASINTYANVDGWVHLAARVLYDTAYKDAYLYANGEIVASNTSCPYTKNTWDGVTITDTYYDGLGNAASAWTAQFVGYMEDILVFDKALTTGELQAIINQGHTWIPPSGNYMAYGDDRFAYEAGSKFTY
jgi:hypothetical protein